MATVTKTLKDAAYVTVGLGVLGLQQAQIRSRQLQQQVGQLTERVPASVLGAVGQVGERVPGSAREVLAQASTAAREVPAQVRGLVARTPLGTRS